jgi:dipeptidase E
MKKLFLASSFKDVAHLLVDFAGEDLKGKTVTFIPTASIPEKMKFYVGAGKKDLEKLGLVIDELEISKAKAAEIADKLQQNDYIYISGGNTFFLLQELRRTKADKHLMDQINSGKLYIGESAGSMVMSPDITYASSLDDHTKAKDLLDFSALHMTKVYPLPHHTNFPFKKSVEKIISKYGSELELYPISNAQVLLVEGEKVRVQGV